MSITDRWAGRLKLLGALSVLLVTLSAKAASPFSIARVHYDGGGDWYSDPSSLVNLLQYASKTLGLPVTPRETVISIEDEDLFRHPYLYLTGHGEVRFSEREVERLRDYLLGGGFLHVDDNYGIDPSFRREIARIFPDHPMVKIPFNHPIYHTVFNFPDGLPKIHQHDGKPPQGFGVVVEDRVLVYYSYESDLGDGWEDPEVHQVPAAKREAALRMGVNLIAYALSGKPRKLP